MKINSSIDVIESYFSSPDAQTIISSMEAIRINAYNAKWWFYKRYWWVIVLVYCVIFYVTFFIKVDRNGELVGLMWFWPWITFYIMWKFKQWQLLKSYKVSTQLFNHFINTIFTWSKFDESNSLYQENMDSSQLFMSDYDDKIGSNSISIPLIAQNNINQVEIQWIEAKYSRTEGSGTDKSTITDEGMLYRVILLNPKRTIKSSVTIIPNRGGLFQQNNIPLEDKEFEEYFDVQSEDPIEARMILTSNVMYELTQFMKQSLEAYNFRFIGNSFYIKKENANSLASMDRDISIISNKKVYMDFYNEMMQLQKLIEALNIDYYNKDD